MGFFFYFSLVHFNSISEVNKQNKIKKKEKKIKLKRKKSWVSKFCFYIQKCCHYVSRVIMWAIEKEQKKRHRNITFSSQKWQFTYKIEYGKFTNHKISNWRFFCIHLPNKQHCLSSNTGTYTFINKNLFQNEKVVAVWLQPIAPHIANSTCTVAWFNLMEWAFNEQKP